MTVQIHEPLLRTRRVAPFALLAALLLLVLTACASGDSSSARRSGTPSDHRTLADPGPLVASLDAGGNSVYRPENAGSTWTATFGSLLICSPTPITLTKVVPHYKVGQAESISFLVRVVPPSRGHQLKDPDRRLAWSPVGTATRSPTQLATDGDLHYDSLTELDHDSVDVDQPCRSDPGSSFTEILTTLSTNAGGVWIDRLDIDYVANGTDFTLPVSWSYVACGDLTVTKDVCRLSGAASP